MEQRNSGGTVEQWRNSGTVEEQWNSRGTVEQWRNSGTVE